MGAMVELAEEYRATYNKITAPLFMSSKVYAHAHFFAIKTTFPRNIKVQTLHRRSVSIYEQARHFSHGY